jgi:signal transduction histidine kinase
VNLFATLGFGHYLKRTCDRTLKPACKSAALTTAIGFSVFMNPIFPRLETSLKRLKKLPNDFLMPVLTTAVIVSLIFVAIGSLNTTNISQGFERGVTNDFQLQRLGDDIVYYDEVLTMSARMAAATGNLAWEKRYAAFEPELTRAIDRVIEINDQGYDLQIDPITKANIKLIDMEAKAFKLVEQQRSKEALSLLFSKEYKAQKEIYASGMQKWSEILRQKIKANLKKYGRGLFLSSVFSITSFWIMLIAWALLLMMIHQYIRNQKAAEKGLRQAKRQLEINHQELQTSEATLQQKTLTLETTLGELKQAQVQMVQSEKMSSLGQLVAGVAHEINNPVNFIHANLEPINDYMTGLLGLVDSYELHYPEPKPEIQQEIKSLELDFVRSDLPKILESMAVGTQRIRQIVLSLRNFSRSDEVGYKSVDIHEGLESTLLILQYRIKDKSECSAIEIVRDYAEALPKVECSPGQLNQVFMNLLSNAVDAIDDAYAQRSDRLSDNPSDNLDKSSDDPGDDLANPTKSADPAKSDDRGAITLRTQVQTIAGEDWVEIAIADTGLGIPETVQARIFDAFFTTKPVGKGTGMGLSISYSIITEKHNGRLICNSTLGQGTEFLIQLPLAAGV